MEKAKGLCRRDFLKGVAAAAMTAGMIGPSEAANFVKHSKCHQMPPILPHTLQPHPEIRAFKGTERYWAKVRQTFVLPHNYIHFNTGTTGSQPLFSLINLGVYNLYKSMDPKDWQKNLNEDFPDLFPFVNSSALTARQKAVADQYGASQEEIVLSYNTTDACNLIFAGTPWKPGDRIITTHWEHPALAGPIAWARDYRGVEVKIVGLPSNFTASTTVADVQELFETELRQGLGAGNKQYVAFSEIFYKNGVRMPVQEICQLARSYGAYSIIDTAHGWGMLPIDCHAYGADFIAGAGHKWLCGGPGTGILYVRNSGTDLPPFAQGNFYSYGNLFTIPSLRYDNRDWSPASAMQGRGETNTPALYAMTDSAAYFNYLGVEDIYNRGVALGNYLKAKIEATWGANALWVQRNPNPVFATALTAFNPFVGKDDTSQYSDLRTAMNNVVSTLAGEDPKIYIRTVTWRDQPTDSADNRIGFRVSSHGVYNNFQEIDYLFYRLRLAVNATGLPQLG
ncbi:MAG: aminotransferase class V-fold PLP-dependent enzyme [Thermodesulfobacteriota bacterium]